MKKARYLAIILALMLMVTSIAIPTWATGDEDAPLSKKGLTKAIKPEVEMEESASRFDSMDVDDNAEVTAIVIFNEEPLVKLFSAESIRGGRAQAASKRLLNNHGMFFDNISFDYTLNFQYTTLLNGASITTAFKNIKALEAMSNVKAVYLANEYEAPVLETPDMASATVMSGVTGLWDMDYIGQGIVAAVLDTGLNTTHEVFQNTEILGDDLAITDISGYETSVEGKYLSAKVPFSYDYADGDNDVTDTNGHGTHVSGTVVGYLESEDGAIEFSGAAPGAQLVMMKIFHDNQGGTNSGVYFAALEDCYTLGVDVINMSIGAQSGFTYDPYVESELFENLYMALDEAGIIVCCSAGNEENMGVHGMNTLNLQSVLYGYADYYDYGILGTPSSYDGNFSIASVDNIAYPAMAIKTVLADGSYGEPHSYIDNAPAEWGFLAALSGQTIEYVNCGLGTPADFVDEAGNTIDLTGKFALISRGEINFSDKLHNAVAAGAQGVIVYNNEAGAIGMSIDSYDGYAISVLQNAGADFVNAIDPATGIGRVYVGSEEESVANPTAWEMSYFSSWGTTSDLTLKPSLTATGGRVYSAVIGADDAYGVYNGTSMASPNACGAFAVLCGYVNEMYPDMTKAERQSYLEDLTQSTALVLTDSYGDAYSPRKQGAGLIRADLAVMTAESYITNPIAELGDSPDWSGNWDMSFTVKNDSDEDLPFQIVVGAQSDYPTATKDAAGNYTMYNTYQTLALEVGTDFTYTTEYENNIVVVPANSEVEVDINLALTADGIALLGTYYAEGIYVEGYVDFVGTDGYSWFHGTYMGFLGDWSAGQILDNYDFADFFDAYCWLQNTGYYAAGYRYYNLTSWDGSLGVSEGYIAKGDELVYYPGGNLMAYTGYDPNKVSFSNSEADSYYEADNIITMPMQLRNARHLILVVTDAETGEVYYVDDTEYLSKAYWDETNGYYSQRGTFRWDGTDLEGNFVPNNTVATMSYYAWVDYDTETEAAFMALNGDYAGLAGEEFVDCLEWQFDVTVDNQAPVINSIEVVESEVMYGDADLDGAITANDASIILRYLIGRIELTEEQMILADADRNGEVNARDAAKVLRALVGLDEIATDVKELVIKVSDNQYLAYLGIYNNMLERVDAVIPELVDEEYMGGSDYEFTYVLDLEGVEFAEDMIVVSLMDYATNWPDYVVDITTGEVTSDVIPLTPGEYTIYTEMGETMYLLGNEKYEGGIEAIDYATAETVPVWNFELTASGNYKLSCENGYLCQSILYGLTIGEEGDEFCFGFDEEGNTYLLLASTIDANVQRIVAVSTFTGTPIWGLHNARLMGSSSHSFVIGLAD